MLLILCGLLREYQNGLEGVRRLVFDANPNVKFDVALLTSIRMLCSYRDTVNGRAMRGELPRSPEALRQDIRDRLSSQLIYTELRDGPIPNSTCHFSTQAKACFGKGMPSDLHVMPVNAKPAFQYRLANGVDGLAQAGLLGRYNHVLVMRPDSIFTRPLNLRHACNKHPGFNIISGSLQRQLGYFHDRDFDLAYLSCEPQHLQRWLHPWLCNDANCRLPKHSPPPRMPAGFNSSLTVDQCKPFYGIMRFECTAVAGFEKSGVRLGNLDDSHIFVNVLGHEAWVRNGLVAADEYSPERVDNHSATSCNRAVPHSKGTDSVKGLIMYR